ncbi:3-oxo-Delta(4,5)-steroid 5-beta-reductase-like [Senna tora]|uniref:3-oxo-Delta(4,5)-steroid 5-beta-reductase-like n=1 Tax=Senna tora TaxID=362788 RepID=A0A835CJY1_9FABA|nr:3-oxo-Delta(4,5)-steroid 5-beta-reductase-like [Senna tora]
MGPIFDPILLKQLAPHEPPFHESMPCLPYPNFYYALENFVASYAPSVTYSVHRSSIIVGASTRSEINMLLMLAAYAAVCRHEGLPWRYPGNMYMWEHFCDMTDAGVLAEQHVWAAIMDVAKNEAFNCTNGNVFTWKRMWNVMSKEFDVEYVEYKEGEEFDIEEWMSKKGEAWDEIVERNGLYKTKLEKIACYAAFKLVANFTFQHVSNAGILPDRGGVIGGLLRDHEGVCVGAFTEKFPFSINPMALKAEAVRRRMELAIE